MLRDLLFNTNLWINKQIRSPRDRQEYLTCGISSLTVVWIRLKATVKLIPGQSWNKSSIPGRRYSIIKTVNTLTRVILRPLQAKRIMLIYSRKPRVREKLLPSIRTRFIDRAISLATAFPRTIPISMGSARTLVTRACWRNRELNKIKMPWWRKTHVLYDLATVQTVTKMHRGLARNLNTTDSMRQVMVVHSIPNHRVTELWNHRVVLSTRNKIVPKQILRFLAKVNNSNNKINQVSLNLRKLFLNLVYFHLSHWYSQTFFFDLGDHSPQLKNYQYHGSNT